MCLSVLSHSFRAQQLGKVADRTVHIRRLCACDSNQTQHNIVGKRCRKHYYSLTYSIPYLVYLCVSPNSEVVIIGNVLSRYLRL